MEALNSENFEKKIDSSLVSVVLFSLDNNDQCKQVLDLLNEFTQQEQFKNVKCYTVEINSNAPICKMFSVASAPTLVFFHNGNEFGRVAGVNPKATLQEMNKIVEQNSTLEQRLTAIINQSKIMAFIKGSPDQPRCGFTRTLVTLFKELNIEYGSFDILSDMDVRQGLKKFKNWPTYPQVYVGGELLGGLDIIQSLHEDGDLLEALQIQ